MIDDYDERLLATPGECVVVMGMCALGIVTAAILMALYPFRVWFD